MLKPQRMLVLATILASFTKCTVGFPKQFGLNQRFIETENTLRRRAQQVQTASCQGDVMTRRSRSANTSTFSRTALYVGVRYKNFDDMLKSNSGKTVIVYFSAVNCGPCRIQKREVLKLQELVGEKCTILALDTETWPNVATRFQVHALPCLVVFKDGVLLHRFEGVTHANDVVQQLQAFL